MGGLERAKSAVGSGSFGLWRKSNLFIRLYDLQREDAAIGLCWVIL